MTRNEPPLELPNYTAFPNRILDSMGEFTESEMKVIAYICRQTFGFHRKRHRISLTKLEEGTGCSRSSVTKAVKALIAADWIRLADEKKPHAYEIHLADEPKPAPEKKPDPVAEKNGHLHATFIARWSKDYEQQFEVAYSFQGGKDGKAVKTLIATGIELESLRTAYLKAWNHPENYDCKMATTICGFSSRLNQIRVFNPEAQAPRKPAPSAEVKPQHEGIEEW